MATRIVTDNSVVMSWCFEDEIKHNGESVPERLESAKAAVPAI